MKFKLDRIFSLAMLMASLLAVVLVLRKPVPVAHLQTPAEIVANAQSFGLKIGQLEQAARHDSPPPALSGNYQPASAQYQQNAAWTFAPKTEVRINADEVDAALAQAAIAGGTREFSPDLNNGNGTPMIAGNIAGPTIKDQQISFEGDLAHGQFLTEVAGNDVWITVSGRLASKDGYATFEATDFKMGDFNVPVALVNSALQKKLAEQRERLKLPDFVGEMKVQNGELVIQQK